MLVHFLDCHSSTIAFKIKGYLPFSLKVGTHKARASPSGLIPVASGSNALGYNLDGGV